MLHDPEVQGIGPYYPREISARDVVRELLGYVAFIGATWGLYLIVGSL